MTTKYCDQLASRASGLVTLRTWIISDNLIGHSKKNALKMYCPSRAVISASWLSSHSGFYHFLANCVHRLAPFEGRWSRHGFPRTLTLSLSGSNLIQQCLTFNLHKFNETSHDVHSSHVSLLFSHSRFCDSERLVGS